MSENTLNITDGPKLVRRGPHVGVSFYSAYRPLRFSELYGPAKIAGQGLKRAILSNNGYLTYPALAFTGFSGTGKTTLAHILALSLNCKDLQMDSEENLIEPCLECPKCLAILGRGLDGTDTHYIVKSTPKMKNDDIISLIDNDIRSSSALINQTGGTKIICLEEAHNLTTKSIENLLLPVENILSNPRKSRVHLFLTSSEQESLFSNKAWQSRILNIKLSRWTTQDLYNILVDINKNEYEINNKPKLECSVIMEIINKSEASLRYAITLFQGILEQCKPTDNVIYLKDAEFLLEYQNTTETVKVLIDSLINHDVLSCYKFLKASKTNHNLNFDSLAINVVKVLTTRGINALSTGNMAGLKLMKMAKAFNETLSNSLYQDRYTVLALSINAALEAN